MCTFITGVYPPPYRCIYVTHATRALQRHDLAGDGINFGSQTYFFDNTRTVRASPDEGSAQCRATSETTRTWKTIHTIHATIHSTKVNMKGWLWWPNDIGDLCEPDICLIDEEKSRENLTQETCPDWGSKPGLVRDRRACYRLLHSGGLLIKFVSKEITNIPDQLWVQDGNLMTMKWTDINN